MSHEATGTGSEAEARADLGERVRPRLMQYFMAGGLGRGEADDLAQQTLLLALRGLGQLRQPDKLLPWLFAIARRVRATARLRHGFERRHRAGEEELAAAASVEPGVDVLWGDRRRLERLEEAIATLPPQQRQCLLLRVREEASYADIASTLRLSPNTVRNHLAQARQALRAALASGPRLARPARHMQPVANTRHGRSAGRHGSWILALAATAWLCPGPASADVAGADLRSLLARSEMVAIGSVTTVTSTTGSPGLSKARILVEENLKGTAPGSLELGFDPGATESVGFAAGSRVVLFLRRAGTPATIALASRVHGAMEVPPAKLNPARAALRNVIQAGTGLRLSTVRVNLLRASGEPPRPLVGSLLRSLTSTLTSSDASLLTEMACDALNEYLPAARLWALRQAGLQRLAAARSCLEATLVATDLSRRLAAAEALGNLRDTRSLAVLGSVLDSVMNESADGGGRPADGGLAVSLVLALGKLRDPAAVPRLRSVAAGEEDLALHSTVVHALGLIGGTEAVAALTAIGNSHPNTLVRALARQALARLGQGRTS